MHNFQIIALAVSGLSAFCGARGIAQNYRANHPLVDMKSGYLLGGSMQLGKNGQIGFEPPPSLARQTQRGVTYRIYSATKYLGQGRGSEAAGQNAPCPATYFVDVSPNKGAQSEFAISGNWNALPRVPRALLSGRSISAQELEYGESIRRILVNRGIQNPVVRLSRPWIIDLEGDGQDEVLLSATDKDGAWNSISANARAGQYSLIALRKIVKGKVQTIVLQGEFHPQAKKFSAPNFFRLAAVLDVDGDGKMEILTRGQYYEGGWTSVWSMRGDKVREVLSAGCGA